MSTKEQRERTLIRSGLSALAIYAALILFICALVYKMVWLGFIIGGIIGFVMIWSLIYWFMRISEDF
jgi:hypothetical protein